MWHETTLEENPHVGESIGGSNVGGNPYEIPATFSQIAETRSNMVPRAVLMPAAMSCIAGTAISGAIFGTFLFPIFGTVFGFILALVSSIPVSVFVLNVVRLTHGPTIRKSTVVGLAAFCGGLTGFLSVDFGPTHWCSVHLPPASECPERRWPHGCTCVRRQIRTRFAILCPTGLIWTPQPHRR